MGTITSRLHSHYNTQMTNRNERRSGLGRSKDDEGGRRKKKKRSMRKWEVTLNHKKMEIFLTRVLQMKMNKIHVNRMTNKMKKVKVMKAKTQRKVRLTDDLKRVKMEMKKSRKITITRK